MHIYNTYVLLYKHVYWDVQWSVWLVYLSILLGPSLKNFQMNVLYTLKIYKIHVTLPILCLALMMHVESKETHPLSLHCFFVTHSLQMIRNRDILIY